MNKSVIIYHSVWVSGFNVPNLENIENVKKEEMGNMTPDISTFDNMVKS